MNRVKSVPFLRTALFSLLGAVLFTGASSAANQKWSRLEGCRWMENPSNDGDSFHVQYKGKEFIFRLYFVDTCEDSEQIPARVEEQAKFLGVTTERVLEAGHAAQTFTHGFLAAHPFTVVTRWEDARGASRLPRNYAFVLFGENDEHDLASTLAQNGMVRIYGMPADPPGPVGEVQFRSALLKLDADARRQHLGIFGNLGTAGSAAGSGIASDSATGGGSARPMTGSAAPILLPANSHPPDVVDNPAEDDLDSFAIKAAETPLIIQTGIKEDDYSEIPGMKRRPTPTPVPPAPDKSSGQEAPAPGSASGKIDLARPVAPISINKASEAELLSLPGIGPVYASRIIAARPFKSVDDLARVQGIGEKQVAKLRPLLAP